MLEQEKQIRAVRENAEADAAMMYGSFTQDGGNAYSTRQMREPDVPL